MRLLGVECFGEGLRVTMNGLVLLSRGMWVVTLLSLEMEFEREECHGVLFGFGDITHDS